MRILVTGGCGFIGSNFIRYILQHYKPAYVTNVDVLTYAGNLANLDGVVERVVFPMPRGLARQEPVHGG